MSLLVNPSGRLIHYARNTKKMTVLLDKLWFANGVVLSPNEDFIVVSDLASSRLMKVWLNSAKHGQSEVFAEGLPGIGDNLTSDKNGLWVAFPRTADPENPLINQSMARMPWGRKFLARIFTLIELLFSTIEKVYPNDFFRNLADKTGSTEMVSSLFPNRATIMRFDWEGNAIAAYHSYDNAVYTHVLDLDGHLYLGSIAHNYIARVPRKNHL